MTEQDASRDSESDCDIPSDFGICPCEAELEKLPDVVKFIKSLQNCIYRQQSMLNEIRKELKEHVSFFDIFFPRRKSCHFVFSQPYHYEFLLLSVTLVCVVLSTSI
jgi:hypothetical protein